MNQSEEQVNQQKSTVKEIQALSSTINLYKIKKQQRLKQQFLEKTLQECNAEFSIFCQQKHQLKLDDVQFQKSEGKLNKFIGFLNQEIQFAVYFQVDSNLTLNDQVRLNSEKLECYYQSIQLRKSQLFPRINKTNHSKIKRIIIVPIIFLLISGVFEVVQNIVSEQNRLSQEQFLNLEIELTKQIKVDKEIVTIIQTLTSQFDSKLKIKDKEIKELQNSIQDLKNQIAKSSHQCDNLKIQLENIMIQKEKKKLFSIQQMAGEIFTNLNIDILKDFTKIYDKPFIHPLNDAALKKLQKMIAQDGSNPLVCLGAVKSSNKNQLALAGCDLATEIFQNTQNSVKEARQSKNGPICWYWTSGLSFGFAPSCNIDLSEKYYIDSHDQYCETRFSYTANDLGGGRIGHKSNIYINSDFYNLVFYVLI